jgi:low affinity Fe/Cu permease
MLENIRHALTRLGVLTAHPAAFLVVLAYVAVWLALSPETLEWHGVATIATWLMTLVIQRAEHRDTQAIQAKLDELLHSHHRASNALTHVDEEEPEDIEEARKAARAKD